MTPPLQPETEAAPIGYYSVQEGFRIQTQIKGLDFDVTLPKVTHSHNTEIAKYYDSIIKTNNEKLIDYRIGNFDFSRSIVWNGLIYEFPHILFYDIHYETRYTKGLTSVQIVRYDYINGLVFDENGRTYSMEDIFMLYDISQNEADEALLALVGGNYNEIIDCAIYSEDAMYCYAWNGGDLPHGFLVTKTTNGMVSADYYFGFPSSTDRLAPIIGYWAMISQISDEGRNILDGFYFDENGAGWLYHNLEGSFKITSYGLSDDNRITIFFINMGGEIVDWSYDIHSLSENELVFATDGITMPIYKRVQKIESTSDTGTYVVTEIDGTVLDIWGW